MALLVRLVTYVSKAHETRPISFENRNVRGSPAKPEMSVVYSFCDEVQAAVCRCVVQEKDFCEVE